MIVTTDQRKAAIEAIMAHYKSKGVPIKESMISDAQIELHVKEQKEAEALMTKEKEGKKKKEEKKDDQEKKDDKKQRKAQTEKKRGRSAMEDAEGEEDAGSDDGENEEEWGKPKSITERIKQEALRTIRPGGPGQPLGVRDDRVRYVLRQILSGCLPADEVPPVVMRRVDYIKRVYQQFTLALAVKVEKLSDSEEMFQTPLNDIECIVLKEMVAIAKVNVEASGRFSLRFYLNIFLRESELGSWSEKSLKEYKTNSTVTKGMGPEGVQSELWSGGFQALDAVAEWQSSVPQHHALSMVGSILPQDSVSQVAGGRPRGREGLTPGGRGRGNLVGLLTRAMSAKHYAPVWVPGPSECSRCGGGGHRAIGCTSLTAKCFGCGAMGHDASSCLTNRMPM